MKEKIIRVTPQQISELKAGNNIKAFVEMFIKIGANLGGDFKQLLGPYYKDDNQEDEFIFIAKYEDKVGVNKDAN